MIMNEDYDCNDTLTMQTEGFFQGVSHFEPECEYEGFPDFQAIEEQEYDI